MTLGLKRFEKLADAWGGDIVRWPEAEQAAARALLAADPAVQSILTEAAGLDAVLALDVAPAPSDLLVRRVTRAAPGRPLRFGWTSRAGWAAAAAAGLVVGIFVGDQALTSLRADAAFEQAQSYTLDEGDYLG